MHVGPSNSHAAALQQQARGNRPETAPQTPPPQSAPAASTPAITGHSAPMASAATAVHAQIFGSMGPESPGKSGSTPAAIARQIIADNPDYAGMPFGKVVSQVAQGILEAIEPAPAAEAAPDPTAEVDLTAEAAAPVEGNPMAEGDSEATGLTEAAAEAVAAGAANSTEKLIEAFEEGGGGIDIEA